MRPYKVYAIEEGVVIDHIPERKSLKILEILGLSTTHDSLITLGINLDSSKMGHKDVLKIENKELSKEELDKISLVAENASVSLIKDHKVIEKVQISVPSTVEGIIKCGNAKCITNNQPVVTVFEKISSKPLKMKCHHCEKVFSKEDLVF